MSVSMHKYYLEHCYLRDMFDNIGYCRTSDVVGCINVMSHPVQMFNKTGTLLT